MKNLLPKYFSSEWSFAQFRVPDGRTIVAFGADKNSIVVVSADGHFYKALFSEAGGDCIQESYAKFIKSPDLDEQQRGTAAVTTAAASLQSSLALALFSDHAHAPYGFNLRIRLRFNPSLAAAFLDFPFCTPRPVARAKLIQGDNSLTVL